MYRKALYPAPLTEEVKQRVRDKIERLLKEKPSLTLREAERKVYLEYEHSKIFPDDLYAFVFKLFNKMCPRAQKPAMTDLFGLKREQPVQEIDFDALLQVLSARKAEMAAQQEQED